MTTKPKAGERVSEYLARCAAESLLRAGASVSEAADFCDILVVELGDKCRTLKPSDAAVWLEAWRKERRETAEQFREDRQRRLDAGYRGVAVDAPVYLNGETIW